MEKKRLPVLKYLLTILLALFLLYLSFRKIELREFVDGLGSTEWYFISLSVLASLMALVFRALRWRMQLAVIDPSVSFKSVWQSSNVGNFINLIIPGGGELVRCAQVSTPRCSFDRALGSIVMERAWDLFAIVVLFGAAFFGSRATLVPFLEEHVLVSLPESGLSLWWIAVIVAVAAGGFFALVAAMKDRWAFCRKCLDTVAGILSGFTSFRKMKGKLLFIVYTVAIWSMYILMTWFTFLSLPGLSHMTIADALFISAVGNLATVVPTPGNFGAYHYLVGIAISTIYFGTTGILPVALLFATLSHGSRAVLVMALGMISYTDKSIIRGKNA